MVLEIEEAFALVGVLYNGLVDIENLLGFNGNTMKVVVVDRINKVNIQHTVLVYELAECLPILLIAEALNIDGKI